MAKNRKVALEAAARERCREMARKGRLMQRRVFRIAKQMADKGEIVANRKIIDAYGHTSFSHRDFRMGEDITLVMQNMQDGCRYEASFGVSVSIKSVQRSNDRHSNTPTVWFPPDDLTDEQIQTRILFVAEWYSRPIAK